MHFLNKRKYTFIESKIKLKLKLTSIIQELFMTLDGKFSLICKKGKV